MKLRRKILSLILILSMVLSLLSGCALPEDWVSLGGGSSEGDASSPELALPDNTPLKYTLTEQDLTDFEALIDTVRPKLFAAQTCEEAEAEMEVLSDRLEEFQRQSSIAEVLYYCHQDDEKANENYLFSTEAYTTAYLAVMNLETELYDRNPPYRDEYFDGMTPEEVEAFVRRTEQESEHATLQSEITTKFYSDERYADRSRVNELYAEYVKSGNELAIEAGYDDFYDYATENYYFRDYGKEDREAFRGYVKREIVSLYRQSFDAFYDSFEQLSMLEQSLLIRLMDEAPYDELDENYLMNYLNSLSGSTKNGMNHMFEHSYFICADWEDANEGAFTTVIDDPFCYFGPGYYQSTFTVAHELGHYYASLHAENEDFSFDIAETHSQGNEMLLMYYLRKELDPDLYEALVNFKIYSFSYSILIATLIDEFEEQVYKNPEIASYSVAETDKWLEQNVLSRYDLPDDVREGTKEMWKEVCVTSPVYYLSYATSAITALNLYALCLEDEAAAGEAYRKIVEEMDAESDFIGTLTNAGLPTPFEYEAHNHLKQLILK